MAKEPRTELHPWQDEITEEEYLKGLKDGDFYVGYFAPTKQFYRTDIENAEYKKIQAAKTARREDTIKLRKSDYKKTVRDENGKEIEVTVLGYSNRLKKQRQLGKQDAIKDGEMTIKTKEGDVKYLVMKEATFDRKLNTAKNDGLKEAKPQKSNEERLRKAKERKAAEEKKIKELEAKVAKSGKPETKPEEKKED